MTAFFDDPGVLFDDPDYTFDGAFLVTDNTAPEVDAGPDDAITLPTEAVTLAGSATDDGLPADPGEITYLWTATGPGPVLFIDDTDPETDAHFPSPGTYTLTLTASDGELEGSDSMDVVVSPDTPATSDAADWQLAPVGADLLQDEMSGGPCGEEGFNISNG